MHSRSQLFRTFILLTMLFAIIISGTAACSSNPILTQSEETSSPNSWQLTYERFKGERSINLTVPDNKIYILTFEIETEDGSLDLLITDSDDETIYQETQLPTSQFTVELNAGDTYKVNFTGSDHKGSFYVKWSLWAESF